MSLVELFAHPVGQLLTLVLLHFLWQGVAVVYLLVAIVEFCEIRRATVRYACSLAALIVMTLCPLGTLMWLSLKDGTHLQFVAGSAPKSLHAGSLPFEWSRFLPFSVDMPLVAGLSMAQPYILAAWLVGVTLFGVRLLVGAVGLARVRRGRLPLPAKVALVVKQLGHRLQRDALSAVFLSRHVGEAMATGLLRPLVLIPAAWASEMSLEMMEAVIAHELAHLSRRDLWINLLQRILESLFFYHPAVWWLSRRLRVERELCADELAVSMTGRPLEYVQALEQVARWRQTDVRPALAAFLRGETNMSLLNRVQNVLGLKASERSRLWPAGLIALLLPLALWMLSVGMPVVVADDGRDDDKPAAERAVRRVKQIDAKFENDDDEPRNVKRTREREIKPKKVDVIDKSSPEDLEIKPKKISRSEEDIQYRITKRSPEEGRVITELIASVKHLAAEVERLQAQIAELRNEEPRKTVDKEPSRREPKVKDIRSIEQRREYEERRREEVEGQERSRDAKRVRERDDQSRQESIKSRELDVVDKIRAEGEKRANEARERAEQQVKMALEKIHELDNRASEARDRAEKQVEMAREGVRRAKQQAQERAEKAKQEAKEAKEAQPAKEAKEAKDAKESKDGKEIRENYRSLKQFKEPAFRNDRDDDKPSKE